MPKPVVFVPECYLDQALLLLVLMGRQELIDKKHGISQVDAKLRDDYANFGNSRRVMGLVDNDKKFWQNEYLLTFQNVPTSLPLTESNFLLRQHPATEAQQLILLSPGVEAWVLAAAHACQLNPATYQLPATPKLLGERTKHRPVSSDINVLNFLLEIRRRRPTSYQHLADTVSGFLLADE